MVRNHEIQQAFLDRVQVFGLSTLDLANAKEATSGLLNAVEEVEEVHVNLCITWYGVWGLHKGGKEPGPIAHCC